jgi:hypothetical protein
MDNVLVGELARCVQHLAPYCICVLGAGIASLVCRARAAGCPLDVRADQKHQQPWVSSMVAQ